MKKFICILMIVCCVGCLCSCAISQTPTYRGLEERVEYLEKLLGVETHTNSQKHTPSPKKAEEADISVYPLSEMSPDEIIETIKYYISNRPKNGDTLESVKNRILVEPISYNHDNVWKYIEAKFEMSNSPIIKDSISQISYKHCYLEMDGATLGGLENSGKIEIELNIIDYERAEKLFDGLASYFNSICEEEYDVNKEGSLWHFSFYESSFINVLPLDGTDDDFNKVSPNPINSINKITQLSVTMRRNDKGWYNFNISVTIRNI